MIKRINLYLVDYESTLMPDNIHVYRGVIFEIVPNTPVDFSVRLFIEQNSLSKEITDADFLIYNKNDHTSVNRADYFLFKINKKANIKNLKKISDLKTVETDMNQLFKIASSKKNVVFSINLNSLIEVVHPYFEKRLPEFLYALKQMNIL